jgi:hypothetical protein
LLEEENDVIAYRPISWGPRLGQRFMPGVVLSGMDTLAQDVVTPAPPVAVNPNIAVPGSVKAGATVALVSLMIPAVASSYVGFRLGSIDKGLPQVLGYVVGVLGGLGAFGLLLTTAGVLALPSNSL